MKKVTVWHGGKNNGDGSTALYWFLTEAEAEVFDEIGEGSECVGSVETFVGSDIHLEAVENATEDFRN